MHCVSINRSLGDAPGDCEVGDLDNFRDSIFSELSETLHSQGNPLASSLSQEFLGMPCRGSELLDSASSL
jgi:hypothetical protein